MDDVFAGNRFSIDSRAVLDLEDFDENIRDDIADSDWYESDDFASFLPQAYIDEGYYDDFDPNKTSFTPEAFITDEITFGRPGIYRGVLETKKVNEYGGLDPGEEYASPPIIVMGQPEDGYGAGEALVV